MLIYLGFGALVIALLTALFGVVAAVYATRSGGKAANWLESARRSMVISFPLLTVALLCLAALLALGDFQVQFVYSVTSRAMPLHLKVSALWGGQAGSLLFWCWLLAAFLLAAAQRTWAQEQDMLPYMVIVGQITLAFFLGLIILIENPFARFWLLPNGEQVAAVFQPRVALPLLPPDGRGLNPLLRHPGMILHPPMLYLGFVAYVIPFALAVAALITGRSDDAWIRAARRWVLIAWLFLSLGLILGARWAYDVLGWGGYWGWDPVEIAALMPWLSSTAFLHSMVIQERRGLFKRWNVVLIIITYALVILGTFLTRSGVLSSVHAFAQSAIGPLFFAFIAAVLMISLGLLLWRWNALRAEGEVHSLLSREAFFLFNNFLFMGVLAVCLWGVLFPLVSELIGGQRITVGPPFYERAIAPLFGALMFLMAAAPLSAWKRSTFRSLAGTGWKPAVASLFVPAVSLVFGVRNPVALIGLWLAGMVVIFSLYEYGRAVVLRRRRTGQRWITALWTLAGSNRRRYGGYIIHLGMALMALGIIGIELFQAETQGTLAQGESLRLRDYNITYRSLAVFDTSDLRYVVRAAIGVEKDGVLLGELHPRVDYYYDSEQQVTVPAVRATLLDDLYVVLVDWEPISLQAATFKVYDNPLVSWLWIGALVFVVGVMVALWPQKDEEG
ncbi:MAG: heme lyase CcmF/NrfE family subunit [Anaerolineae bacterium]|nr:heme lyase CcmF/NrfE family subunit [Anaerolineae bacterium]